MQITSQHSLNAFLLPIKTVGVQVSSGSGLRAMEHPASCFHKVQFGITLGIQM